MAATVALRSGLSPDLCAVECEVSICTGCTQILTTVQESHLPHCVVSLFFILLIIRHRGKTHSGEFSDCGFSRLRAMLTWRSRAGTTFQMNPKPLYLKDKLSQFHTFEHKIIHRILDDTNLKKISQDDTWEHERFTRNALYDQVLLSLTGLQAPNPGDVLLVGDVDEIPRISTLTALRNCAFPPRVTLRTQMYYYSYQWLHRGDLWHHPQATYYDGPDNTVRPESLRMDEADAELFMSGWHCSSCFGMMVNLKNKITSFSHKHYNQPYFLDTKRLLEKVRRGEDLFEREGEKYDRVDDNPDIPVFLQREENRKKFAYMLDRDPQNGNFQDL